MPTQKQKHAVDLYASLMEEAKARLDSITYTLNGDTGLPEIFADEFCTLQLRMLCEVIALGCLVAHGDIQETHTRRLSQVYAADKICERLEALHPDFYPRPVRQVEPDPPRNFGIEDITTGYLTKPELIELVTKKCGPGLHRGTTKDLGLKSLDPEEIYAYTIKIRTLLDIHWFTLTTGEPHYLCSMNGGIGGTVGVEFLQKGRNG